MNLVQHFNKHNETLYASGQENNNFILCSTNNQDFKLYYGDVLLIYKF